MNQIWHIYFHLILVTVKQLFYRTYNCQLIVTCYCEIWLCNSVAVQKTLPLPWHTGLDLFKVTGMFIFQGKLHFSKWIRWSFEIHKKSCFLIPLAYEWVFFAIAKSPLSSESGATECSFPCKVNNLFTFSKSTTMFLVTAIYFEKMYIRLNYWYFGDLGGHFNYLSMNRAFLENFSPW